MNYFKDVVQGTIDDEYYTVPFSDITLGYIAEHMLDDLAASNQSTNKTSERLLILIKQFLGKVSVEQYLNLVDNLQNYFDVGYISRETVSEEVEWFLRRLATTSYSFGDIGTLSNYHVDQLEYWFKNDRHMVFEELCDKAFLPPHWECPEGMRDTLTDDQYAEYRAMAKEKYDSLTSSQRNDLYIAYTTWNKLVHADTTPTTTDTDYISKLMDSDPEELAQRYAQITNRVSVNSSSGTRRSTGNAESTQRYITRLANDLRANYIKLIQNTFLDIQNREYNRAIEKHSNALTHLTKLINIASDIGFKEQIDAINNNPDSNWFITPDPYSNQYYVAVSKRFVTITGNDNEDYFDECGDGSDEKFFYGHIAVRFDRCQIDRVQLGGVAPVLNALGISVHPHKDYNGNSNFCWGNIEGQVSSALTGDHSSMTNSTHGRAVGTLRNLEIISKEAFNSLESNKAHIDIVRELAPYFRIYDLNKYLTLVWQILAFADYGNPYIYLSYENLDRKAHDYVRDMDSDDRESLFGDYDFSAEDFHDVTANLETKFPGWYRQSIKVMYANGIGDKEALASATKQFKHEYCNDESVMYDDILSNETTDTNTNNSDFSADEIPF